MDPFFAKEDGRLITRHDIQSIVERAAVALGAHATDMGTDLLRIGGASALYAKFRDTALVQGWGRWKSDAVYSYPWEASSMAKGVAESMGKADVRLV